MSRKRVVPAVRVGTTVFGAGVLVHLVSSMSWPWSTLVIALLTAVGEMIARFLASLKGEH